MWHWHAVRRTLHIDLHDAVSKQKWQTALERRVSTTSAINRGLRATKDGSWNATGRDRSARPVTGRDADGQRKYKREDDGPPQRAFASRIVSARGSRQPGDDLFGRTSRSASKSRTTRDRGSRQSTVGDPPTARLRERDRDSAGQVQSSRFSGQRESYNGKDDRLRTRRRTDRLRDLDDGASRRREGPATGHARSETKQRDAFNRPKQSLGRPSPASPSRHSDAFDEPVTPSPHKKAKVHQISAYDDPVSVPYTTAASQFLYGTNVVLAALRSKRRKLYRLHVHPRFDTSREERSSAGYDLVGLAQKAGIPIDKNANTRLLDRMSGDRPHNGVVLETSSIPVLPVLSLGEPDVKTGTTPLYLAPQTAEDRAINGSSTTLPTSVKDRQPLVLLLDGILDPANLGSILRTAHFFRVDAVAVATNTCASIDSAVVAKASSGACEAVPILTLPKPSDFVRESRKRGWKAFGAVALGLRSSSSLGIGGEKQVATTTADVAISSPLAENPVILMLGSEGEGLRANLVRQAHGLVSIEQGGGHDGGRSGVMDVGVDSLNVGVAAGVLMEAFLRGVTKGVRTHFGQTSVAKQAGSDRPEGSAEGGDLGF